MASKKTAPTPAGWAFPGIGKRWHYFPEGSIMSLCSKWAYSGDREDGNDGSPDNCADCRKRKAKLAPVASKGD